MELHVSVWNDDGLYDDFMGHCSIPITDPTSCKSDRWYSLLSKPSHINIANTALEKKSLSLTNARKGTKIISYNDKAKVIRDFSTKFKS